MVTIAPLKCVEEIEQCEKLPIDHKLWGTISSIEAFGQRGYIEGKEWVVKLTAMEKNPLTTFENDEDPVYKDSALEVFLNFAVERDEYLNLEVNSNGALLCHFGRKGKRAPIASGTDKKIQVLTETLEDKWSVLLRVPYDLIRDCFEEANLKSGSKITFNLYKICESKSNLHFISHTFIPTERPDFHQPACFAEGVLG